MTKEDLKTALDETTKKIVTEMSEVINVGFAMAITKTEFNERMDKVDSQLVTIKQKQLDSDAKFNVLERRVGAINNRVAALENH